MGVSIPQVKGMQAVEFKEGESDIFEFDVQEDDENVETYSEAEVEELKNTISDLQTKIAQFKEDAKKQETIKSLKTQVKDLTIELARFKDEAAGKEELAKELKEIKDNLRNKDFNEFIDKQINAGILTPANKDAVFSIFKLEHH